MKKYLKGIAVITASIIGLSGSVSDMVVSGQPAQIQVMSEDPMDIRGGVNSDRYKAYKAAPTSNAGITHDSRFDDKSYYWGIDVSKYQSEIDWQKVKASGIDYAIVRLGFRSYESGVMALDPYFKKNVEGAYNAGIKVGLYFFTQAINADEAVEEAEYVVENIAEYADYISYPIYFDMEDLSKNGKYYGRQYSADLTTDQRTEICEAFCNKIIDSGYASGVYTNLSWAKNKLKMSELEDYSIWFARYSSTTGYTGKYDLWQYTSTGSVDGIAGAIDMDVEYREPEQDAVKLSAETVTADAIKSKTYNGKEYKPGISLTDNTTSEKLVEGNDYTVVYKNNVNAGKATACVYGRNKYTGVFNLEYTIKKANLKITVPETSIEKAVGSEPFSLNAKVTTGGALSYVSSDESVVQVDSKGQVTVVGEGKAEITISTVANASCNPAESVKVSVRVGDIIPKIVVEKNNFEKVYGDESFPIGATIDEKYNLTYSTDNSAVAVVDADGNVELTGAGKAVITIHGAPVDENDATVIDDVAVTVDVGKANDVISLSKSEISKTYGCASFSVGATSISGEGLVYSSDKKSVAKVNSKGMITIKGPGVATITVSSGISEDNTKYNKAEAVTLKIKVKPAKPVIEGFCSSGKGKLVANWTGDPKVSGYEIQYGLKKDVKSAIPVKVKKGTAIAKTLVNLKSKRTYYVRIRSYKKVGEEKIYSSWSKMMKTMSI